MRIYWIPAKGGEAHFVTKDGQNPSFNSEGDRIYYQKGGFLFGSLDKSYCSVNLDGEDKKVHFHSKFHTKIFFFLCNNTVYSH